MILFLTDLIKKKSLTAHHVLWKQICITEWVTTVLVCRQSLFEFQPSQQHLASLLKHSSSFVLRDQQTSSLDLQVNRFEKYRTSQKNTYLSLLSLVVLLCKETR